MFCFAFKEVFGVLVKPDKACMIYEVSEIRCLLINLSLVTVMRRT